MNFKFPNVKFPLKKRPPQGSNNPDAPPEQQPWKPSGPIASLPWGGKQKPWEGNQPGGGNTEPGTVRGGRDFLSRVERGKREIGAISPPQTGGLTPYEQPVQTGGLTPQEPGNTPPVMAGEPQPAGGPPGAEDVIDPNWNKKKKPPPQEPPPQEPPPVGPPEPPIEPPPPQEPPPQAPPPQAPPPRPAPAAPPTPPPSPVGPDPRPAAGKDQLQGPTAWDVNKKQLTSWQMNKLMQKGNPLMEAASEKARRNWEASGGQNSLMAEQAGELAMIQSAFQIGAADAATYARSAEFNAAMSNQFGLANNAFVYNSLLSEQNFKQSKVLLQEQIRGTLAGIDKQISGQFKLAAQEQGFWMERLGKGLEADLKKMSFGAGLDEEKARRDFGRTWQLYAAQNRFNFFSNGFQGMAEIGSNPNLTPEQANGAMQNYMNMVKGGMGIVDGFYTAPLYSGPPTDGNDDPYNTDWGNYLMYPGGPQG